MDIKEIITRNYAATVRRGLIKPDTISYEFVDKLREEVHELSIETWEGTKESVCNEMADCILVVLAMATHFNIDILSELEKKVIFNEKRSD